MIFIYIALLFFLSWYSFALIDPNITFFNSPIWSQFLTQMLQLGYYHRDISIYMYISIVIALFIFYFYFVRNHKQYRPFTIAICIGLVLIFSYPFLSHDLFNYLFDAKILTYYHQNPYLHKALDFPFDSWLRFMQWTHRSYPYGPVFLIISAVPSFLAFGKFLLSFLFYKITNIIFYLIAIYLLQKKSTKWAMMLATHPLVIIEGLVNGHNDMIALSLGIIGICYLFAKKNILARYLFILSGGIKYITVPLIALSKKNHLFIFAILFFLLGYLSFQAEIQPWYFLALFLLIPYYERFFSQLNLFFLGLLLSYYPYILLGGWDTQEKVSLKHTIILIAVAVNVLYILIIHRNLFKRKFLMR